jgi:hypothetical protein
MSAVTAGSHAPQRSFGADRFEELEIGSGNPDAGICDLLQFTPDVWVKPD